MRVCLFLKKNHENHVSSVAITLNFLAPPLNEPFDIVFLIKGMFWPQWR
jgi:hypothetical protein